MFWPVLEIRNLSKTFVNSEKPVLDGLNLTIQKGEFFSLLGPSGCGKTTLLRMIAGFEHQDMGEIRLDGHLLSRESTPRERPFNIVFQKYALFPHLSVFDNMAFGLRAKKISEVEVRARVNEMLDMTRLKGFEDRYPTTLSGGQAQRVAVARALVNKPRILLLDEPLSALDMKMRAHMQKELRELQQQLGLTFIYVTHDQEEAFALSDRIAVMNGGKIEQVDRPQALYDDPQSLFVARFVGNISEIGYQSSPKKDGSYVQVTCGGLGICGKPQRLFQTEKLVIVRPERIDLDIGRDFPSHYNRVKGKVLRTVFRGTYVELEVMLNDQIKLNALIPPHEIEKNKVREGDVVPLSFDPEDTIVFMEVSS